MRARIGALSGALFARVRETYPRQQNNYIDIC